MIVWTPVAVNETPALRGRVLLPECSAAVIGSSVVLRVYSGGLTSLGIALTTIPFATAGDAQAWVDANGVDLNYESRLPSERD